LQELTESLADVLAKVRDTKPNLSARQNSLRGSRCNHKCPSESDPDLHKMGCTGQCLCSKQKTLSDDLINKHTQLQREMS
jgi:hypothetical protein